MTSTLIEATRTGRSFVPGHITGLFRIYDLDDDPLRRGSIGAGFSIGSGTITRVTLEAVDSPEVIVRYNGVQIEGQVTRAVIELMSQEYGQSYKATVQHDSELPIGVGFGASGAGALGTALAMNQALDSHFDHIRAAQFAHVAEVKNRTGLGDVIAQFSGGIEIRVSPGAPGIGETRNIPFSEPLNVTLAGSPGLETSEVLSDPVSRERINRAGDMIAKRLIEEPTFERFIECSREFSALTGLMTVRVKKALQDLEDNHLADSSMVMLGDSIFCFCDDDHTDMATRILNKYWSKHEILVTTIESTGGRVI